MQRPKIKCGAHNQALKARFNSVDTLLTANGLVSVVSRAFSARAEFSLDVQAFFQSLSLISVSVLVALISAVAALLIDRITSAVARWFAAVLFPFVLLFCILDAGLARCGTDRSIQRGRCLELACRFWRAWFHQQWLRSL